MSIQTINPTTELIIDTYPVFTQSEIEHHIEAAHLQFQNWRLVNFKDKAKLMLNLAKVFRTKCHEFTLLMAKEMGKPISAGKAEIEKCILVCEHYAQHAQSYLEPQYINTENYISKVCYQPYGVIFAIMPWNFPFWQVLRFAAPNLMAGNVGLLKHAPISTGTGFAIQEAFEEAGFPKYTFSTMVLTNEQAATVIAHEHIRGITFTGSEPTGKILAATAGSYLKKVVMELGGNDPYVILGDADLDLATEIIVAARLNNTGQTCIAPKRIIIVADIADVLIEKIITRAKAFQCGDPLNPETELGPMAREDLRARVHQQVLESIAKGALLCLGGVLPEQRGFYYPPTILTNVRPGMPAFDEEIFGPVFAITIALDEAEALALANQTRFGLGAAVFTQDLEHGERIATYSLEAGQAFVNKAVVSDPRLPFGGTKHSGYGRELGQEGIKEFMNLKTVVVNESKA